MQQKFNARKTVLAVSIGLALAMGLFACGGGGGGGDSSAPVSEFKGNAWMDPSIIAEQAAATTDAAKEAVAKALGCGLGPVGFHDIELHRSESGAPALSLNGAAVPLAEAAGIASWLVSATHTDTVAQTVVIALDATSGARPAAR